MKVFYLISKPYLLKDNWKDIQKLSNFRDSFPKYKKISWGCQIEDEGINLLDKILMLNPKERITAKEALEHVK